MSHSPYSSDLAPAVVNLFKKLKNVIKYFNSYVVIAVNFIDFLLLQTRYILHPVPSDHFQSKRIHFFQMLFCQLLSLVSVLGDTCQIPCNSLNVFIPSSECSTPICFFLVLVWSICYLVHLWPAHSLTFVTLSMMSVTFVICLMVVFGTLLFLVISNYLKRVYYQTCELSH